MIGIKDGFHGFLQGIRINVYTLKYIERSKTYVYMIFLFYEGICIL